MMKKPMEEVIKFCLAAEKSEEQSASMGMCNDVARLFRQATLFFNHRKILYLLEATKKFWPMENYEEVTKTLKRNGNIYVCLAAFHVISAIIKRMLMAHTSGLYVPKLIPRWAVIAVVDICHIVGATAFTSYDIMVKHFSNSNIIV
nr:unnamed protein product [Callosobruchus analis]